MMVEFRKLKVDDVEKARSVLIAKATEARNDLISRMNTGHREYEEMDRSFEDFKQYLKAADVLAGWNTVDKAKS